MLSNLSLVSGLVIITKPPLPVDIVHLSGANFLLLALCRYTFTSAFCFSLNTHLQSIALFPACDNTKGTVQYLVTYAYTNNNCLLCASNIIVSVAIPTPPLDSYSSYQYTDQFGY